MSTAERLAEQFEEDRSHLRAVAYRMLGSVSEAEAAVQEAWIRLSRTDVNSGPPKRTSSRRPAEGHKLADAAVPQVQAAPGKNSDNQRNRRTRRVCDPQMSGHRAAKIAGHQDCGNDRGLRDKIEHHR